MNACVWQGLSELIDGLRGERRIGNVQYSQRRQLRKNRNRVVGDRGAAKVQTSDVRQSRDWQQITVLQRCILNYKLAEVREPRRKSRYFCGIIRPARGHLYDCGRDVRSDTPEC